MTLRAVNVSLSGMQAAFDRLNASSHNVANLLTEDFRPLEAHQLEEAGGGSRTVVRQAAQPREVDLGRELVDQALASLQAKAGMRVIETELDMLGRIVDLKV